MHSLSGRLLLSIGAVGTIIGPYIADWNAQHTFGPGFSAHARYHAAESIFTSTGMGLIALWLIWKRPQQDWAMRRNVAALIPIIHWGTYNLAAFVPTTSVDGDERKLPRLFGVIPLALVAQNMVAVVTAIGYWVDRCQR